MRMNLSIPYGYALDDFQTETEKVMRDLSKIAAVIAVKLPK
jgi:hypothetical protein